MYYLLRKILFRLDAEKAHNLALKALHLTPKFCFATPKIHPVKALGLEFSHPVGLAAGLDKNGQHIDALAKLGFSFIEVGTVTPRPQPGNAKPRLFRLPEQHALINRMGFNNHGVTEVVANIEKTSFQGILGINIGKNKETPLNKAVEDYIYCLQKVYLHASYVTVNISSPNTPDLRQLQSDDYFDELINELRNEQLQLTEKHQRYVPLVIKVSPDEPDENLKKMAYRMVANGMDGIIASNTTCARYDVAKRSHNKETGGLSGRPLAKRSTECLRLLKSVVGDDMTLIGSGGIDSPSIAQEKLAAGASLLQLYTGLIYEGPDLVKRLTEGF